MKMAAPVCVLGITMTEKPSAQYLNVCDARWNRMRALSDCESAFDEIEAPNFSRKSPRH